MCVLQHLTLVYNKCPIVNMASDAWIHILRRYIHGRTEEASQPGDVGGVSACASWQVVPASLLRGISAALQGARGTEMLSLPGEVAAHASLWLDFAAEEEAIEATVLPVADKAMILEGIVQDYVRRFAWVCLQLLPTGTDIPSDEARQQELTHAGLEIGAADGHGNNCLIFALLQGLSVQCGLLHADMCRRGVHSRQGRPCVARR